jgi:Protein of unknown function (DUF1176)
MPTHDQLAHRFKMAIPGLLFSILLTPGVRAQVHEYQDWATACDNTRHCQALGYQAKDSNSEAVAMHLRRDAGPHAPLQISLTWEEKGQNDQIATLSIGKLVLSSVKTDQDLPDLQVRQILPAMLKAEQAVLKTATAQRTLSLAGLNAALLKMDDLQGRIDTPGALVRKGRKPEASALPPLQPPKVRIAPLTALISEDKALLNEILKSIKNRDCFDDIPDSANPETILKAVSNTQVLVMRECSRGAYQTGSALWLANRKAPHAPQALMLPTPSGEPLDLVMNAHLEGGILSSWSKGRGINDCGQEMTWGWNGKQFALIGASTAPLCRGLPMGGFMLSIWQAKEVP